MGKEENGESSNRKAEVLRESEVFSGGECGVARFLLGSRRDVHEI
jgi:hypothetical protein